MTSHNALIAVTTHWRVNHLLIRGIKCHGTKELRRCPPRTLQRTAIRDCNHGSGWKWNHAHFWCLIQRLCRHVSQAVTFIRSKKILSFTFFLSLLFTIPP